MAVWGFQNKIGGTAFSEFVYASADSDAVRVRSRRTLGIGEIIVVNQAVGREITPPDELQLRDYALR